LIERVEQISASSRLSSSGVSSAGMQIARIAQLEQRGTAWRAAAVCGATLIGTTCEVRGA
jgi:hypothetical protein